MNTWPLSYSVFLALAFWVVIAASIHSCTADINHESQPERELIEHLRRNGGMVSFGIAQQWQWQNRFGNTEALMAPIQRYNGILQQKNCSHFI